MDHRERQVAPHSMAFNCTATQLKTFYFNPYCYFDVNFYYLFSLYCGYEDAIEVFDFQRPGEGTKIPTTPSKKSKEGMKGIFFKNNERSRTWLTKLGRRHHFFNRICSRLFGSLCCIEPDFCNNPLLRGVWRRPDCIFGWDGL